MMSVDLLTTPSIPLFPKISQQHDVSLLVTELRDLDSVTSRQSLEVVNRLRSQILALVLIPHASKFFEYLLSQAGLTSFARSWICEEVLFHCSDDCIIHCSGNYVVQSALSHASLTQLLCFSHRVREQVTSLALQRHGAFVLERLHARLLEDFYIPLRLNRSELTQLEDYVSAVVAVFSRDIRAFFPHPSACHVILQLMRKECQRLLQPLLTALEIETDVILRRGAPLTTQILVSAFPLSQTIEDRVVRTMRNDVFLLGYTSCTSSILSYFLQHSNYRDVMRGRLMAQCFGSEGDEEVWRVCRLQPLLDNDNTVTSLLFVLLEVADLTQLMWIARVTSPHRGEIERMRWGRLFLDLMTKRLAYIYDMRSTLLA